MINADTCRIPVHVLTGFLGSGKTTLLNDILRHPALAGSAVIINEFGSVGLDHHLVETGDDTIIELSNGCLCCTVRGQLVETIEGLLDRKPDRILIETTGLADPVPVLQALIASPVIADRITFAGMLTTFAATDGLATLSRHSEAKKQAALADTIVITKLDLLPEKDRADTRETMNRELQALNPAALILTREVFLENPELQFSLRPNAPSLPPVDTHFHHHQDTNRHNDRISATILTADTPLARRQIDNFLELLLSAHSDHVLRIKGLVQLESDPRPLLVQAVGNRLSDPLFLEKWPFETPKTQLVVFLENMQADFVQRLFSGFLNRPMIDTSDHQGLVDNPLSIAGYSPGRKK